MKNLSITNSQSLKNPGQISRTNYNSEPHFQGESAPARRQTDAQQPVSPSFSELEQQQTEAKQLFAVRLEQQRIEREQRELREKLEAEQQKLDAEQSFLRKLERDRIEREQKLAAEQAEELRKIEAQRAFAAKLERDRIELQQKIATERAEKERQLAQEIERKRTELMKSFR